MPRLLLDLTLPTAAENLALDDALLEEAEEAAVLDRPTSEILRLWEPRETMVVIGRSSRLADEVDVATCHQRRVPMLRRASGGAAIVTGPGCLMYALVLSYARRPGLRMIDEAHRFVLSRMVSALRPLCPGVNAAGTSDLAIAGRKFSGNSMRCRREYFLYHGTLLYDFPLEEIGGLLRSPPRQPAYRAGREHGDFVINLAANANQIRQALCDRWKASDPLTTWPQDRVLRLVEEKYLSPAWNAERVGRLSSGV